MQNNMLQEGQEILEGRFKIMKKLGCGAFGEIFKGKPHSLPPTQANPDGRLKVAAAQAWENAFFIVNTSAPDALFKWKRRKLESSTQLRS